MGAGVRPHIQSGFYQLANFFPGEEGLAVWRQISIGAVRYDKDRGRQPTTYEVRSYHSREILKAVIECEYDGIIGQRPIFAPGALKLVQREHSMVFLQVIEVLQKERQRNVLFMGIGLDGMFAVDYAVITENRNALSIYPRDCTDHTSRMKTGKEKLFHVLSGCVHVHDSSA
jgi:hypothetical protein